MLPPQRCQSSETPRKHKTTPRGHGGGTAADVAQHVLRTHVGGHVLYVDVLLRRQCWALHGQTTTHRQIPCQCIALYWCRTLCCTQNQKEKKKGTHHGAPGYEHISHCVLLWAVINPPAAATQCANTTTQQRAVGRLHCAWHQSPWVPRCWCCVQKHRWSVELHARGQHSNTCSTSPRVGACVPICCAHRVCTWTHPRPCCLRHYRRAAPHLLMCVCISWFAPCAHKSNATAATHPAA